MSADGSPPAIDVLRRVAQTPGAFSNWPSLLCSMALERLDLGPAVLRFNARVGLTIDCPNQPGARGPVYEAFVDDGYRLASFLRDVRREPMRVIDVGGHIGTFACRFAQLCPEAEIECFEPSATAARFLRQNVARNGFAARVMVTEAAVAARAGTAQFAGADGADKSSRIAPDPPADAGTSTVVTVAFDEIVRSLDKPVDFVKLDCEGAEYELVFASSPTSWSTVSRVVLEHHPHPKFGWPDLRRWFEACGLHAVGYRMGPVPSVGIAWLAREVRSGAAAADAKGNVP